MAVAGTGRDPPVELVGEELGAEELERRLELGDVDVLALARAPPVVERRQQRRGREALRDEVGVGAVDHDRRAIGPPGELVEPGQPGHQVAEASIQPPGSGLALHARRQHHHRRVAGADLRVVHAPSRRGPWG